MIDSKQLASSPLIQNKDTEVNGSEIQTNIEKSQVQAIQVKEDPKEQAEGSQEEYESSNESLFTSKKINKTVRYFTTFYLIVLITCQIISNIVTGVQVMFYYQIQGHEGVKNMRSLTLKDTLQQMWNAKTYALALLFSFGASILPFAIQIILSLCWFLPQNNLKYKVRDFVLFFVSQIVKYCSITAYIMTLMILAFRYSIVQKFTVFHADIEVKVKPTVAYYLAVNAYLSTQLVSSLIIYQHRKIDPDLYERMRNKKNCQITFYTSESHKKAVLINLISIVILYTFVIISDQFSFKFIGFAGAVYNLLDIQTQQNYSMLTMMTKFLNDCFDPDYFFLHLSQFILLMTTIVAPIVYMVCSYVQNVHKFRFRSGYKIYRITEFVFGLSTVEPFLLSIFVAMLQMQQFARYIAQTNCNGEINNFIEYLDQMKIINLNGDDRCFDLVTKLEIGIIFLIPVSIILIGNGAILIRKNYFSLKTGPLEQIKD